MLRTALTALLCATAFSVLHAADPPAAFPTPPLLLPPALPWAGASRALVVEDDHPWVTPCERSGLTETPRYDATVAWLERLAAAAPEIELVSLGKSHEGRDIRMAIVSREGAATPEALRQNGRPTVLAQGGIHAGEIDGKDAGLMLLRDLTVRGTRRGLLDGANLLFVPIFNVDGHERFSAYNRINQRGPREHGWRTTARNLNLNRDYAKLDTPEMRAMVRALHLWEPDLYLDLHVTDGADYQYDITFGFLGAHGHSPAIARWLEVVFRPYVTGALEEAGHVPGPLVFAADRTDLRKGVVEWSPSPRYSDGYGSARHLPAVLVENHSLKPYDQRVLGTYVLLEAALRCVAANASGLHEAIAGDRARRPTEVPLSWAAASGEPSEREFLGVAYERRRSSIHGGYWVEWKGVPETWRVPVHRRDRPEVVARRPRAYWVHAAWPEVIERLELHGIRCERIARLRDVDVEVDRIVDPALAASVFEGRVRVSAASFESERRRERFAPGSVRVDTNQPLGDLAVLLLDPRGPDSFFQWGFFLEVLQRTEYVEPYVVDPLAERLLATDEDLARSFDEEAEATPELRSDEHASRRWFYERTPYHDERYLLLPVAREVESDP